MTSFLVMGALIQDCHTVNTELSIIIACFLGGGNVPSTLEMIGRESQPQKSLCSPPFE